MPEPSGSCGLRRSSAAARISAAGKERAGQREEAGFLGRAVLSQQPSLESISTTASSEDLLVASRPSCTTPRRLRSFDRSEAFDDGSWWTPSTGTTPSADDPQDRWFESDPFVFSSLPTARLGPHSDALRRVQRVHDFRVVYDLDAVGELDESARPAFQLGKLRRVPRSLDFRELEGVLEFQSVMQIE
jgi:hypothetical protein